MGSNVSTTSGGDLLELLNRRTRENWLIGQDSQAFLDLTEDWVQEFAAHHRSGARSVLIAEPDPIRCLAGFLASLIADTTVFLGNPSWGETEWRQALALAQPDRIWGAQHSQVSRYLTDPVLSPKLDPDLERPLVMIPTGGSSGTIRFVMHRWRTLATAVSGLQQYLGWERIDSACVLPVHHVSGLMQFVRSFLSGGSLWVGSFKTLKIGLDSAPDPWNGSISLVPTQLKALLDCPHTLEWLSGCKAIFLGGAPSWPDLLDQAHSAQLPLSPCYGMTETAAQIATLKPDHFLAGQRGVGQTLPHAQITITDDQGRSLAPRTTGRVVIAAESLALGYYPTLWPQGAGYFTDDMGFVDEQGYLHLVGRTSHKIITGGENVFPPEVEAAIWSSGWVSDVSVLGWPDPYWGQRVVAVYVPRDPRLVWQQLEAFIQDRIARPKHPKLWISAPSLPRNAQGKVDLKALRAWVEQWIGDHAD